MLEYNYQQNWISQMGSDYEDLENKQINLRQIVSEVWSYKFLSKEWYDESDI